MPKPRWAVWADAVAFVGEFKLPDVISVNIEDILKVVTHKQGDGGCMFSFPTGRDVKGEIAFNAIDADLLNLILGGTKTTGTKSNVRFGTENHTIAYDGDEHSIMLACGSNVQKETVEVYDENLVHYKKTDIFPPGGQHEFHPKDSGRIYFNVADTGKVVYPSYFYDNSGVGSKVSVGKNDIPGRMELWIAIRAKNLNEYLDSDSMHDIVIHLAKINKTGTTKIGADDEQNTSGYSFAFTAVIEQDSDREIYFPKNKIHIAVLLEDYAGNNICDYDGELIGIGYTEEWS